MSDQSVHPWADKEWAEGFIKQENNLGTANSYVNEEDYFSEFENLHEQWLEMNKETKELVWKMRAQ